MTEEEAVDILNALTLDNPEAAHLRADLVLIDFLKHNGYTKIAEAWNRADDRVEFWYE